MPLHGNSMILVLIACVLPGDSNDLSDVQLVNNWRNTCYTRFGHVACWGDNTYGQLARGITSATPITLASDANHIDFGSSFLAESIYAGAYHLCALSTDACVKCWGLGTRGQLYNDTQNRGDSMDDLGDQWPCVDFGANFTVATLGLGANFSCALSTNARVRCWGTGCSAEPAGGTVLLPTADVPFGDDFVPIWCSTESRWRHALLYGEGAADPRRRCACAVRL